MFWEINSKMTTLIVDILNHKHKITANLQPCQNIVLAIWGIFRNKQQFQLVSWWFEPVNHYGLYQGWNKQQNNPFKVLGLLKQKQKNNNDIKKQTLSVTRAETDRLFTTANDVTQRNDVTLHISHGCFVTGASADTHRQNAVNQITPIHKFHYLFTFIYSVCELKKKNQHFIQ